MYADAWGYMAVIRGLYSDFVPPIPLDLILAEGNRAVAIDMNQAWGTQAQAGVRFRQHDFSSATEALARRAVDLAPRSPDSRLTLSLVVIARGRPAEGVALARVAIAIDSLAPLSWAALYLRLINARQYDEAIAAHDHLVQLDPSGHPWKSRRRDIAGYRLLQGRCGEAETEARALNDSLLLINSLACEGKREEARALMDARRQRDTTPVTAALWARLAERDSMFAQIDRLEARDPGSTVFGLMTSPVYDPYRKDPRFLAIVRRAGVDLP